MEVLKAGIAMVALVVLTSIACPGCATAREPVTELGQITIDSDGLVGWRGARVGGFDVAGLGSDHRLVVAIKPVDVSQCDGVPYGALIDGHQVDVVALTGDRSVMFVFAASEAVLLTMGESLEVRACGVGLTFRGAAFARLAEFASMALEQQRKQMAT